MHLKDNFTVKIIFFNIIKMIDINYGVHYNYIISKSIVRRIVYKEILVITYEIKGGGVVIMIKKIFLGILISIILVIIVNEFILLSRYRESISLVLSINIVTLIAVIVIGVFIIDNLKKLK